MDLRRAALRVAADPAGPGVPGAMEAVQMGIRAPDGMGEKEAVSRAKALVPCEVGDWEGDGERYPGEDGSYSLVGLMDCEEGFYDGAPRHSVYGPDDAGVVVEWEKP